MVAFGTTCLRKLYLVFDFMKWITKQEKWSITQQKRFGKNFSPCKRTKSGEYYGQTTQDDLWALKSGGEQQGFQYD